MKQATIPKPVIMVFKQDAGVIFKEVRHFDLIEGPTLLTEKINLSRNRGFSNAQYKYSLKVRKDGKWSKQITGLFPTNDSNIFYGDLSSKSHLFICQFLDDGHRIRCFIFQDFYTRNITDFLTLFKNNYQ